MRREDCPPALLGSLRSSRASRYLACFRLFVVSPRGACRGGSLHGTPGPLLARWPKPGMWPGDRGLSHVPELPLWLDAPLSDPGGVLDPCPGVSRTAAFRPLETVGFSLRTALRVIRLSTTIPIAGLNHAACILVPSSSVRPLLGVHVDLTPDLLARLWSGGTCAFALTHWGTATHFMRCALNPKVSDLPWRDQCVVRPRPAPPPGPSLPCPLPASLWRNGS
jgi:hypothetical protein